jgi:Na+/H+ antiporter NhaC
MAMVKVAQQHTSATGSTRDRVRLLMMVSITLAMVSKVDTGVLALVSLGGGGHGDKLSLLLYERSLYRRSPA